MNDTKRPELVYHYCSLESFYLIIRNKTLRLSDITKSNDSMELMLPKDDIVYILEDAYENVETQYLKKFMTVEEFRKHVKDNMNNYFNDKLRNSIFFVMCFSGTQSGDLLSQWRGYADDGRGVAIGFDVDTLREIISDSEASVFSMINYNDKGQRHIVKKCAEKLINELKKMARAKLIGNERRVPKKEKAFSECFEDILSKSAFMKKPFLRKNMNGGYATASIHRATLKQRIRL